MFELLIIAAIPAAYAFGKYRGRRSVWKRFYPEQGGYQYDYDAPQGGPVTRLGRRFR